MQSLALRRTAAFVCIVLAVAALVLAARNLRTDFLRSLLAAFLFVVTLAYLRSAYLIAFRWSPLALRHLVAAIFFPLTIGTIVKLPHPHLWLALIAFYLAYQLTTFALTRWIFRKPRPDTAQPAH